MILGNNIVYLSFNSVEIWEVVGEQGIKILYSAKAEEVNDDDIKKLIAKIKDVTLIINSKTEYSEYKTFDSKLSHDSIKRLLKQHIDASKSFLWMMNNITLSSNDKIITTIKNPPEEAHISRIFDIFLKSKIRIRYVTSFVTLISSLYCNKRTININAILCQEYLYISVSSGEFFILGRQIVYRSSETILTTIARSIGIVIKYVNTTMSFINLPLNINIISTFSLTPDELTEYEPILKEIKFNIFDATMCNVVNSNIKTHNKPELDIVHSVIKLNNTSTPHQFYNIALHSRRWTYILMFFAIFCNMLALAALCCIVGYISYNVHIINKNRIKLNDEIVNIKRKTLRLKSSNKLSKSDVNNAILTLMKKSYTATTGRELEFLQLLNKVIASIDNRCMFLNYDYFTSFVDSKLTYNFSGTLLINNQSNDQKDLLEMENNIKTAFTKELAVVKYNEVNVTLTQTSISSKEAEVQIKILATEKQNVS